MMLFLAIVGGITVTMFGLAALAVIFAVVSALVHERPLVNGRYVPRDDPM